MDERRFDRLSFVGGMLIASLVLGAAWWFGLREPPALRKTGSGPFGRGRVHVMEGRYAEAVPELRAYLAQYTAGPNRSRAGLFLGKAYLGQGHFKLAREAFAETAERYPDTLEGHKCRYKLALLDLLEGRTGEAAEGFRRLAEQPDGPLAPEATALGQYLAEP